MSLDVYLYSNKEERKGGGSGIFIRENGATREITLTEWNERFPGTEPVVFHNDQTDKNGNEVYWRNITHNVGRMANEAGIYEHLWRPDEIGITKAVDLIEPLQKGLALLISDPTRFKAFNPYNGWGSYEGLIEFVTEYLVACEENPTATVHVSR